MSFDTSQPVLVIEPNLLTLKQLKQMLVRLDILAIDVTEVPSKALQMVKRKRYGLIICNYFNSPMNGWDLMRILRKDPATADIPFILTATQEPDLALTAQARELLKAMAIRPMTPATLRSRIQMACAMVAKPAA